MSIRCAHYGVIAAAWLLSGCSLLSNSAESVWSALSGDDSGTTASRPADDNRGSVIPIPPAAAESNPLPTLNPRPAAASIVRGNLTPTPVTPGFPSGTYVGTKVQA